MLATNIILPTFPALAAAFGISSRDLSLTLSSFFMAFAAGQVVVGPLSDRFGRRQLVLGGLIVFILGCTICASADSLGTLIAGRIIQALGASAASVLSRAIARDLFEGEPLARALSLTMIAMAAAPGFSPLLGSALGAIFGWRSTFILVGVLGGVLGLYYLARMGETHPSDRRAAHSVRTVASAYVNLAVDVKFIRPGLAVGFLAGGLFAFFGVTPTILIDVLGLSPLDLALFFAGTVFVVFGAGLLAPRLARRWDARKVAVAGTIIAIAGGAILLTETAAPSFTLFVVSITTFLFGMGLVSPLGTAIALQPFGQQAGLASALLGFLQMACAAIGTALGTALPFPPTMALGGLLFGGSFLAFLLFPNHRS
ncbi:multidrug effflux MFS transporter [Microvirga arabica]|nr:multidrug effflux MFS transporter [Microvirga arabica]